MFLQKRRSYRNFSLRIISLVSSLLIVASSSTVSAQSIPPEKVNVNWQEQHFAISDIREKLRIFGRQNNDQTDVWLHHPGSGISFEAECEGEITFDLEIYFNSDFPTLYFTVFVDGQRQGQARGESIAVVNNGQSKQKISLAANLPAGKHKIEFYRQNEAGMGQVKLTNLTIKGNLLNQDYQHPRLEFIGDSITAGYGLYTNANFPITDTYYGDATKSYAFLAARDLNADFNILAVSGYGLIAGWGKEKNMVKLFPFTNWFQNQNEGGLHPFKEQAVDVICINLGTNDWNARGSTETDISVEPGHFNGGIIQFTQLIRQYYPQAKIVWLYGMILGTNPFDQQIIAATEYLGGEANGIYHLQLPAGRNGLIGHPDASEQARAAAKLKEFLAGILPSPISTTSEDKQIIEEKAAIQTSVQTLTEQTEEIETEVRSQQADEKIIRFMILCSILVLITLSVFAIFKILKRQ